MHQHLIQYCLGDFWELFFQTDHQLSKFCQTNTVGTNATQTMSSDCLIGEAERVIEKEKQKEEIVPDKDIIFSLPKIPTILDKEDCEIKQEIKKQKDDEINQEINLVRLKDETDVGEIPKEIELYFGGENYSFFLMCLQIGLNKYNENFIDFLSIVDWFADLQGKHALDSYQNRKYF